jgi:hypothetical protein
VFVNDCREEVWGEDDWRRRWRKWSDESLEEESDDQKERRWAHRLTVAQPVLARKGSPPAPTILDRGFYLDIAKKLGSHLIALRRKNKYLNKKAVKYFDFKFVSTNTLLSNKLNPPGSCSTLYHMKFIQVCISIQYFI